MPVQGALHRLSTFTLLLCLLLLLLLAQLMRCCCWVKQRHEEGDAVSCECCRHTWFGGRQGGQQA
jgi:hypothetical protein